MAMLTNAFTMFYNGFSNNDYGLTAIPCEKMSFEK